MKEITERTHYTSSVLYQIELTAKYCKMLGNQLFSINGFDVNAEEFIVLDTLQCNPNICQRDLAKLILKDRANTGKLLDSLVAKQLIERTLTTRNNRTVKILNLSQKGQEVTEDISEILRLPISQVKEKIKHHDLKKICDMLQELRTILSETLEIQI